MSENASHYEHPGLAAARHFNLSIESYALFRNSSSGVAIARFGGDLGDADAVERWALAHSRMEPDRRPAADDPPLTKDEL